MMKSIFCLELFTRCVFGGNEYLDNKDEIDHPKPIIQEYKQELKSFDMEATFYGPDCKGCSGITKSGHEVKNTVYYKGLRVVAADKKIDLYTKLKIVFEDGTSIKAIVLDRGGDIKGNRLDILVESEKESYKYGRKKVEVFIIND